MAKISISSILSGFNRSKINAAIQSIVSELNNKVLYRDNPTGEPNSMANDLDMDSNDILNANTVGMQQLVLAGQTYLNIDTSNVIITQSEVQTLTAGQVTVVFTNDTTKGTFYLNSDSADSGRLVAGTDYSVDHATNTVTLEESYPAGSQLVMVYFEGDDSANLGSDWDGSHLLMGNYHLWIDATGDLRIKSSAPSSDTDGTIVGTQS